MSADENAIGDVSKTNAKSKVNLTDDFTSKLEIVLGLSNKVIYGLFIFWVIITGVGVTIGTIGSITINGVSLSGMNPDAAMQVSTMVFPIVSSLVTLLLGTIIGRRMNNNEV